MSIIRLKLQKLKKINLKQKALKVALAFIMTFSLMPPFQHIYANGSLSAPFVGYNIYMYDIDRNQYLSSADFDIDFSGLRFNCSSYNQSGACSIWTATSGSTSVLDADMTFQQNYNPTRNFYHIDIVLDANYYGSVVITIKNSDDTTNVSRTYYVNGNHLEFDVNASDKTVQNTLTINSYNLTLIEEPIFKFFNFPMESYPSISMLINKGFVIDGLTDDFYYGYPIFEEDSTIQIANSTSSRISGQYQKVKLIMWSSRSIYNATQFSNYFTYSSNFDIANFKQIGRSASGYIFSLDFVNNSNTETGINLYSKYSTGKFILIYIFPYIDGQELYLSTDFALQFGLTNSMLDDIDFIKQYTQLIANGNSASSSASSSVNNQTSEMNDATSDLISQENTFNSNLNSNLNNIDTNFNMNSFGGSFLTSANWVRTQYDNLVNNTPFASLVTFSLLIGLSMIILGKVFK